MKHGFTFQATSIQGIIEYGQAKTLMSSKDLLCIRLKLASGALFQNAVLLDPFPFSLIDQ